MPSSPWCWRMFLEQSTIPKFTINGCYKPSNITIDLLTLWYQEASIPQHGRFIIDLRTWLFFGLEPCEYSAWDAFGSKNIRTPLVPCRWLIWSRLNPTDAHLQQRHQRVAWLRVNDVTAMRLCFFCFLCLCAWYGWGDDMRWWCLVIWAANHPTKRFHKMIWLSQVVFFSG